jgi:hypothetical protein
MHARQVVALNKTRRTLTRFLNKSGEALLCQAAHFDID